MIDIYLCFLDSTDSSSITTATLNVPGNSQRSYSPNSTIATLTSLPTAPRVTTNYPNLNNSTTTEPSKLKQKSVKIFSLWYFK